MGVSEWGARALDVQVPAGKRGKEGGEREIERESHCNPKLGNRRATKCCSWLVSSTMPVRHVAAQRLQPTLSRRGRDPRRLAKTKVRTESTRVRPLEI